MSGKIYRFTIYADDDTIAALSWLAAMTRTPKMYLGGELLKRSVEQAVNELQDMLDQELTDMDEARSDAEPDLYDAMLDDEPDLGSYDAE
jgi:predicted transcriptional regulator